MTRATARAAYPEDLWSLMTWAKHRGVVMSLETNTSAHGGTDVKIWLRNRPDYYEWWVEKTQYGMGRHDFERWARKVEKLASEATP